MKAASARPTQSTVGVHIALVTEPRYAGREIEREMLNAIVHCRVRGIFEFVRKPLETRGVRLQSLGSGVHLTGGCSMLPGICELAEEIFGIPAPRACLKGISTAASALENPRFTCALGLAKLAAEIET